MGLASFANTLIVPTVVDFECIVGTFLLRFEHYKAVWPIPRTSIPALP